MAPDLTAALVAQFISIRSAADAALALLGAQQAPLPAPKDEPDLTPAGCPHERALPYATTAGNFMICPDCDTDTGKDLAHAELPDRASPVD